MRRGPLGRALRSQLEDLAARLSTTAEPQQGRLAARPAWSTHGPPRPLSVTLSKLLWLSSPIPPSGAHLHFRKPPPLHESSGCTGMSQSRWPLVLNSLLQPCPALLGFYSPMSTIFCVCVSGGVCMCVCVKHLLAYCSVNAPQLSPLRAKSRCWGEDCTCVIKKPSARYS